MTKVTMLSAVSVLALAGGVWASSSPYEPPEGGDEWQKITVTLAGTPLDKDAKGKAVFACNTGETFHRVQLQASNLVKSGTYSVWLVKLDNSKKKVLKQLRVDNPNRRLKADRYGKLALASNITACPAGRYDQVQVRYHQDGRPKNVKGATTAAVGDIK